MKKLISVMVLIFSLLAAAHPVAARERVIAFSPYETPEVLATQIRTSLNLAANLEAGDTAVFIDGYALQTLGVFTVPNDPKYRHPKARMALNRQAVGALLQFKANAQAVGAPGHPSVPGAVKLPQLLRFAGEHFKSGDGLDVLVFGSARYDDPQEPAFSMKDGAFPADGHLSASRGQTPYGAADNPKLLDGARVHIIHHDPFQQDRLRYYTRRFWTLYVEALSGEMVSYGSDATSILARIRNGAAGNAHGFATHGDTAKVEMVQLTPPSAAPSIFERRLSRRPLAEQDIRRADNLEIGISWLCEHCDIDLHAAPRPGGEALYFGNTKSADGRYWKDFRQSPQTLNGYETISFFGPLDLNAVVVVINFYSGRMPGGVTGELRITANHRTYSAPFHLAAETGAPNKPAVKALLRQADSGRDHGGTILVDVAAIVRAAPIQTAQGESP